MGLYNNTPGHKPLTRMVKTNKKWFFEECKKNGWLGCLFVPEVESEHGAGAILLRLVLVHVREGRKIEIPIPEGQSLSEQ